MNVAVDPQVVLLQTGLIEHLGCYVLTGRTRAIGCAARLAWQLAGHEALTPAAQARWQEMAEALERLVWPGHDPAAADGVASAQAAAVRGPVRHSRPWLTWDSGLGRAGCD